MTIQKVANFITAQFLFFVDLHCTPINEIGVGIENMLKRICNYHSLKTGLTTSFRSINKK